MEKMTRISLPLSVEEREAYRAWAKREGVDPRGHMRSVLRMALIENGYIGQPTVQEAHQGPQIAFIVNIYAETHRAPAAPQGFDVACNNE